MCVEIFAVATHRHKLTCTTNEGADLNALSSFTFVYQKNFNIDIECALGVRVCLRASKSTHVASFTLPDVRHPAPAALRSVLKHTQVNLVYFAALHTHISFIDFQ